MDIAGLSSKKIADLYEVRLQSVQFLLFLAVLYVYFV